MNTSKINPQLPIINNNMKQIIFLSFLILLSCKKQTSTSNLQQPTLVGKWNQTKLEQYEVTGNLNALISNQQFDSCYIIFKPNNLLKGTISECDTNQQSTWKQTNNQLIINDSIVYTIQNLSKDSFNLERIYQKDILKIKDVIYYKRL